MLDDAGPPANCALVGGTIAVGAAWMIGGLWVAALVGSLLFVFVSGLAVLEVYAMELLRAVDGGDVTGTPETGLLSVDEIDSIMAARRRAGLDDDEL